MKPLSIIAIALSLFVAGCSDDSSTPNTPSPSTNPIFTASLVPSNEVPPVTNAESTVTGNVTITMTTTRDSGGNITAATANFAVTLGGFPAGSTVNLAHIHPGAAGTNGSPVVNLALQPGEVTVANGLSSFTKNNITVDPAVANQIVNNPANFYFNVHSTLNPGGFARGQLVKTN
jgi:hypothetical protein